MLVAAWRNLVDIAYCNATQKVFDQWQTDQLHRRRYGASLQW
jgi:hypothetical protein